MPTPFENAQLNLQLYDLRRDPGETQNVIVDSAAASARTEMASALRRWLRETSDLWPEVPQPGAGARERPLSGHF